MAISIKDIEKMSNDELIDEYERICINYVNLGKEIYFRTTKEVLTNEENQKTQRVNLVMNTNLYDFACEVGHENNIKDGVKSYVSQFSNDDNR